MAVKASRINFFIDSAEQDAVVPWLRTGMFQGVTTNPQLMQAAGRKLADIEDIYTWARAGGAKEVCFQVWGADADAQYRSAMQIREAAPGSTIKVPATGKLIVGAWMPKSMRRLATSSAVTPVAFVRGRRSRMHSCATSPPGPR